MIDISRDDLRIISDIIKAHIPGHEIKVIGSRANGNAKQFSDLDLVIMSEDHIPPLTMALLREAFTESDLTFKVDIIDWSTVSKEFRETIGDQMQPLINSGNKSTLPALSGK